MSHQPGRRLARTVAGAFAAVAIVATGLAGSVAQASPPAKPGVTSPDAKIKPELLAKLNEEKAKTGTDFWVRLAAKADLSQEAAIADWNHRGTAVAAALRETAAASQAPLRAQLDAKGIQYEAFWATNAIRITSGTLGLAKELAARGEVEGLYNTQQIEAPKITPGETERQINALEWGIANINADKVWNTYGAKGDGIVVASIDTGAQFDHPALVDHYRGKKPDGTFDHNYSWFNAAGTSADKPTDTNGHGTHVTGTMTGDDGAGNQIGVAPGAKWISANGCCPSDAALINSGQWMLEPKNLAGQNPDASKRPHIVNNSWGTTLPSNEPFMEDITNAWTASGIFGVFANGNSGTRGCQSSGSPGSLTSNYSAGAYDINNNIASFSGRGVGQNGTIKPNVSAPGVNVRSSVPGSGYSSFNGTSMASPHLSGTVALLWSAAPTLKGNVTATRALLDDTATDKEDAQCGGTADDNNVYGEGRLDALKLLQAAPIGDNGTLAGTITATGGAALAGATVTAKSAGQPDKVITAGPDGKYTAALPKGDYSLTVAAFGYTSQTAAVTIAADETVTKNFVLASAPTVTVSGSVTDGSGHGWPLYAKVSVQGPGGAYDFTTPSNGRYSFKLPSGAAYTLKVDALYPGYQSTTVPVTVGSGNLVKNVAVPVRSDACTTAPGYKQAFDGTSQPFDGDTAPEGWTVADNKGNGQTWKFTDVGNRGNLTGGSGKFAIVDSDKYGSGGAQDTSLVSPVVDLTGHTAPVLRFNQDFNYYNGEKADVDLSIDGGTTWTTVLSQGADTRGLKEIAIPQAAGKSAVQVRFHYYNASFEYWWQVDNVFVGTVNCVPDGGGLVVGNVKDANTGGAVNGAVVSRADKPEEKGTSVATPEDTGLADGFFWLYSSQDGTHGFTTSASGYVGTSKDVDVEADWVTSTEATLAAGRLSVTPGAVDATLTMPSGKTTKSVTVTNTGTAPAKVKFAEQDEGFVIANPDGSTTASSKITSSQGAPLQRITGPTSFAAAGGTGKSSGKGVSPAIVQPAAPPWTNIANYPTTIQDHRAVELDGKIYSIAGVHGAGVDTGNGYVYDPASLGWTAIAPMPAARSAATQGAVNGKIIVSGGWADAGPDKAGWSYDPAANAWTPIADNPAPRSAAGQAVLGGKLYAVGGCTTNECTPMSDSVVRYDPVSNSWENLAKYPEALAFTACGAIDDKVVCSGGVDASSAGKKSSYAYDPATNSWSAVADAPATHWAAAYAVTGDKLVVSAGVQNGAQTNASFAYDATANAWTALPNANVVGYRGAAACGYFKIGGAAGTSRVSTSENLPGLGDCASTAADVSWMTLDKTEATLAPGESVTVKVGLKAAVDQPGVYSGAVKITEDTPYSVAPVGVKLTVNPPSTWSKITGTVTGVSTSGAEAPLKGATVQVDSWAQSYTFVTDAKGEYAYWLDRRNNPLTLIAAKDGYKPQTRTTELLEDEAVVEDFALKSVK